MLKRPQYSKRRIAEQLGPLADRLAELLLGCALQDLKEWPGAICLAPAAAGDLAWAEQLITTSHGRRYLMAQQDGNLGDRIMQIDGLLRAQGERKVIMLGTDCPALDAAYLAQAANALDHHDVVLGPARDGGVVLMGSARGWPPLAELPWSSAELAAALQTQCEMTGCKVATLGTRSDVDTLADVRGLAASLASDERDSRVALRRWLASNRANLERAS